MGSAVPQLYPPLARSARPDAGPTLVQWAYDHLLSMLVSMEIAPGARIGIDAVARKLGISQTPIREALSRLEAEKLVNKVPNVGYRASNQMTRAEVNDLFEMRMLIEPYASRRAAAAMDEDAATILSDLERETRDVHAERSAAYASFASADARLHRLVAHLGGNRFVAEAMEGLHAHLHIFRLLYSTNAPQEASDEHADLIAALLARDGDGAEQAMRHHLERSRARMLRALDALEAAPAVAG